MSDLARTAPAGVLYTGFAAPAAARQRIDAVDLLRGLVMVIMLLDHTRDFFHESGLTADPTDLTRTTPALFLTRWITHFCAPVFVLLAGLGAALQLQRGKTVGEVSRFLWTRGLWLIVLEFTVVRFGVLFNLDYGTGLFAQVIWVLGVCMIALAAIIRLPRRAVGAFGVAMILVHNALDGIRVSSWSGPGSAVPGIWEQLWLVLHQPGLVVLSASQNIAVFVLYPLIPWIGVMAAGFALGEVYAWEAARRRQWLLRAGAAVTLGFIVLRATNLYGDPAMWSVQPRGAVFTALSYLNTTKYPASLLFLAMTLGPALLALAWFERPERSAADRRWLARAMVMFGTVPLFFYVLQWFTAHGLGWLAHLVAGKPTAHMTLGPFAPPELLQGIGFPLPIVYVGWIMGLALLYPICRWFAGVKRRRRDWWLGYL